MALQEYRPRETKSSMKTFHWAIIRSGFAPATRLAQMRGTPTAYLFARHLPDAVTQVNHERMCRLAGVSRAGFHRTLEQHYGVEQDIELRSEIQKIAIEHRRSYGYRRVQRTLKKRGFVVNHKRVLRMMKEDDLLSLRQHKFVVTHQKACGQP